MTSTFELFSVVREKVKAWEECRECINGVFKLADVKPLNNMVNPRWQCPYCKGEGGAWHEAVQSISGSDSKCVTYIDKDGDGSIRYIVTKPSILVREWEVCSECRGHKEILWRFNKAVKFKSGKVGVMPNQRELRPCEHCHRDTDGNPTGAEPGTAGVWRVEEAKP